MHVASRSDAVLTAPEVICRSLIEAFGLATEPLPVLPQLPPAPIVCNWHQRYDTDAGHAWLRDQTREALLGVLAQ
jgi:DNA-binding transcriptional LysR family regulator